MFGKKDPTDMLLKGFATPEDLAKSGTIPSAEDVLALNEQLASIKVRLITAQTETKQSLNKELTSSFYKGVLAFATVGIVYGFFAGWLDLRDPMIASIMTILIRESMDIAKVIVGNGKIDDFSKLRESKPEPLSKSEPPK